MHIFKKTISFMIFSAFYVTITCESYSIGSFFETSKRISSNDYYPLITQQNQNDFSYSPNIDHPGTNVEVELYQSFPHYDQTRADEYLEVNETFSKKHGLSKLVSNQLCTCTERNYPDGVNEIIDTLNYLRKNEKIRDPSLKKNGIRFVGIKALHIAKKRVTGRIDKNNYHEIINILAHHSVVLGGKQGPKKWN